MRPLLLLLPLANEAQISVNFDALLNIFFQSVSFLLSSRFGFVFPFRALVLRSALVIIETVDSSSTQQTGKGKSFRRSVGFCVSGSPHLNPMNLVPFPFTFCYTYFFKHFFRIVSYFFVLVFPCFCCLCVTYLCEQLTLRFSPFGGNHLFAQMLDSDLLSGPLFSLLGYEEGLGAYHSEGSMR